MTLTLALLAALATSPPAGASPATAASAAQVSLPGTDARAVLAGTWQTTSTWYKTAYSTAGNGNDTTVCGWSAGTTYLVCSQQYVAPFGSGSDLSVYTRTAKGYGFVTINADGSTHAPALEVQRDGSLVYTSTFQDRAVRVIDRAVNRFPSPNLELWTVSFSTDGGRTWTTMANGRASKVTP